MAVTLHAVRTLKRELELTYQQRHTDQSMLRDFWHGRYWERVDREARSVNSLFRDLRSSKSDVGPELKIVRNVLQEVSLKYQTYLCPLPMIRVPNDDPTSTRSRNQANLKEQCLYGLWGENEMTVKFADIAWFLPLMGDCFLGCLPDLDQKLVRAIVRSPENAYPVPSYDLFGQPKAIIFAWKIRESVAKREFAQYNAKFALPEHVGKARRRDPDPEVEILEWTDENEFARWIGDQKIAGVQHDFGRNLFRQIKFINVPGETWGHGAVEQSVGRVELGNALSSMIFDQAMNTVYAPLVLEDPQKFSEQIPYGPGAVLAVNPGGKAYHLTPPAGALAAQAALLAENERSIKEATSMPDVNFGQFDASIITGKAINELQGAGTGSVVEMVQGVGIGSGVSYWNETALYVLRRMFANDTVYLQGVRPRSRFDLKPQEFGWKHKGKEIVGSLRNDVVFNPYIGLHDKVIINLQLLGGGIVSKRYARDQVGILNSDEMTEEIAAEAIDEGVIGAIVGAMQQDPSPEHAAQAEGQIASYFGGSPAPHPLLGMGAGLVSGQPQPQPQAGPPQAGPPQGQPQGPPQGQPQGAPQGPGQGQGSGVVSLSAAIAAFQSVQGLNGQVYLVGEIVVRGQTVGDIEVALTDGDDRQTLQSSLPQYAGRMVFRSVTGPPSERFVDVTPGSPATPGGEGKASPEELRRVFVQ